MVRFFMALSSSLFYFGLVLAVTKSLAAAIAVAICGLFVMFFVFCLLDVAHQADETASKFHRTHFKAGEIKIHPTVSTGVTMIKGIARNK
jgi:hypothetical protein